MTRDASIVGRVFVACLVAAGLTGVCAAQIEDAPLAITTTSLPNGTVGVHYSVTLAATGGVTPYSWTVPGGLPAGLNLNADSGDITGTPAATYDGTLEVEVADSSSPQQTAKAVLNLTIDRLTPTLTADPSGVVITLGSQATVDLTGKNFLGSNVALSCSNLPADATCGFSGEGQWGSNESALLTISVGKPTASHKSNSRTAYGMVFPGALALLGLALARNRRGILILCVLLLLVSATAMVGCNYDYHEPYAPPPRLPGPTPVKVTASNGTQAASATVWVTEEE